MVQFKEGTIHFLGCWMIMQLVVFQLHAQCIDPQNLNFSNVGNDIATLSWDNHPTASEYRFACRIKGTNKWAEVVTTTTSSVVATALLSGTTYEWGIRVICPTLDSNFIFGPDFTTTGPSACGVPSNLTANVLSENSATLSWDPSNGSSSYKVIYWLRDAMGSETDPSPNRLVETTDTNSITLQGLQSGTTYLWTIRNVCDFIPLESDLSVFESFQTQGTIRCEDPAKLSLSYSSSGAITFSCDPAAGATEYRFAYHEIGSANEWVEIIQIDSPDFTPTLTPGADYEWGIRTICENDNTVSEFIYGTDYQSGDRCRVPRNLRSYERRIGIILRWNRRNEALNYDLQIRVQGTSGWWTYQVPWFAVLLTGFTPGVTYEWQVRSVCNATSDFVSEYSDIASFTAGASAAMVSGHIEQSFNPKSNFAQSLTDAALSRLQVRSLSEFPGISPYSMGPNPARDFIQIDPLFSERIINVSLVNTKGERISIPMQNQAYSWKLPLNDLSRGIYILSITTEEGLFKERIVLI